MTDFLQMFTGVPQNSILSSLLFNIMLIDFRCPKKWLIKVFFYTDGVAAQITARDNRDDRQLGVSARQYENAGILNIFVL